MKEPSDCNVTVVSKFLASKPWAISVSMKSALRRTSWSEEGNRLITGKKNLRDFEAQYFLQQTLNGSGFRGKRRDGSGNQIMLDRKQNVRPYIAEDDSVHMHVPKLWGKVKDIVYCQH